MNLAKVILAFKKGFTFLKKALFSGSKLSLFKRKGPTKGKKSPKGSKSPSSNTLKLIRGFKPLYTSNLSKDKL